MKNFKDILGISLILLALVGGVGCAIYSVALRFANPDWTETRLIIEHKELIIYTLGIVTSYIIGSKLVK